MVRSAAVVLDENGFLITEALHRLDDPKGRRDRRGRHQTPEGARINWRGDGRCRRLDRFVRRGASGQQQHRRERGGKSPPSRGSPAVAIGYRRHAPHPNPRVNLPGDVGTTVNEGFSRCRYDTNPAPTSERFTFRAALGDEAPGSTRGGSRMAEVETMVAALRRTADRGDGRGIRFYANPSAAEHRTYADLDRAARSDAALLAEAGHRRGDVAVLAFDPGLDFIRSVFAAFYAGMAIAPVPIAVGRDPRGTSDRLLAVVRDSGSRLILTGGQALDPVLDAGPGLSDHADVRHLGVEADVDRADAWQPPAIDGDSLAILQYTSGSTGRPKGVIITHGNLVANQRAITAATRTHSEDSLVGWLPHYHDMGLIGALLNPVYQGHELTHTPAQFLRRPVFWLRLITDHRATLTVGPDFAYNLCSRLVTDEQLAQLDLSSLRRVITGAEPVRAATLAAFADRFAAAGFRASAFNPAYGMAETTLLVTAHVTDNAVQPRFLGCRGP